MCPPTSYREAFTMSRTAEKQIAWESRLLRRKRGYQSSLVLSGVLSMLVLMTFFVVPSEVLEENSAGEIAVATFAFFTLAVAYFNARLDHIETIERLRADSAASPD